MGNRISSITDIKPLVLNKIHTHSMEELTCLILFWMYHYATDETIINIIKVLNCPRLTQDMMSVQTDDISYDEYETVSNIYMSILKKYNVKFFSYTLVYRLFYLMVRNNWLELSIDYMNVLDSYHGNKLCTFMCNGIHEVHLWNNSNLNMVQLFPSISQFEQFMERCMKLQKRRKISAVNTHDMYFTYI
jgi:hypothetical protein